MQTNMTITKTQKKPTGREIRAAIADLEARLTKATLDYAAELRDAVVQGSDNNNPAADKVDSLFTSRIRELHIAIDSLRFALLGIVGPQLKRLSEGK